MMAMAELNKTMNVRKYARKVRSLASLVRSMASWSVLLIPELSIS
jgi:hypothetical protein